MKNRFFLWVVFAAALMMLTFEFGGSAGASHKLVKVGGAKNQCDCTYRIE